MSIWFRHEHHSVCISCRECYHSISICPKCGSETTWTGINFKAPRKNSNDWKIIEVLNSAGLGIGSYYKMTLSEAKAEAKNNRAKKSEANVHADELRRANWDNRWKSRSREEQEKRDEYEARKKQEKEDKLLRARAEHGHPLVPLTKQERKTRRRTKFNQKILRRGLRQDVNF